jgi:methionyl-tRNA formyltransferase
MHIFFAGSPSFAVPSLDAIAASQHQICGVLTSPDKEAGRGKKIESSRVKEAALAHGLPVFTPEKLHQQCIEEVKGLKPDILVVAAYGKIFKKEFLDIFPKGGINLHPSLLPRHRGPSPVAATIIAGDSVGGVTIQKLALRMDSGDILVQKRFHLNGTETTGELEHRFSLMGAELLVKILDDIEQGKAVLYTQKEDQATYCKLIKKENGSIAWEEPVIIIERKIRAYYPWPGAYTTFKGLHLVITRANIVHTEKKDEEKKSGYVIGWNKESGLLVQTGEGVLGILRLQLQSKNEMDFRAFLNGHRDIINCYLGEANV